MHRRHVAVSRLASIIQTGVLLAMLCAALGLLAHSILVNGQSGQIAGHTRLKPEAP
jgi:hypothetical protein